MPKRSSPSVFWDEGYVRLTLRPLNCLAFIIIPLAVYHVYTWRYGTHLLAPRDVGRLLNYFGATAGFLPPLLVLATLFGQHAAHKYPWRLQITAIAGMPIESVAWVLPMLGLNYLTSRLAAVDIVTEPSSFMQNVLQALGAGIYEEFIFRLVFISLSMLVLVHLCSLRKDLAAIVAIVAGAVLFSLYHFSGGQSGEAGGFPWAPFIFRTLAGVYLGGLYVFRGFGIAVGTHAVWNVWVALVNS
jgi:membrane protease YdiL (CAAX protease family)